MKIIIKGKKVNVNYELSFKSNKEPIIKSNVTEIEEVEVKILDNSDFVFSKGEEIYFDENTSAKILNVKKTLDGLVYVYTDYEIKEEDKEEVKIIQQMYERAYEKYANDLLTLYPNIKRILELMGKPNLSPHELVDAIKSFNGVQNDFFTK